jgi:hypothetical protein
MEGEKKEKEGERREIRGGGRVRMRTCVGNMRTVYTYTCIRIYMYIHVEVVASGEALSYWCTRP